MPYFSILLSIQHFNKSRVFVCHCGLNIAQTVDVKEVVEYGKTLPNVVYCEDNMYSCSDDTQQHIKEIVKRMALNRVVIAACTPRTHEPLFQETIRDAGLNKYLLEFANIRDQCSWIHMGEPESATEKAKDLLKMAVKKARLLIPLKRVEIDVIQKALVIGGGIAGMCSALSLADQGFEVFLIEKESELGGNLKHIYETIEGRDVQYFLKKTIERIKNHKLIKVFTEAEIKSISGFIGNYETIITQRNQKQETEEPIKIRHGVVIVATGAREYKVSEYLYGKDKRVITQRELEQRFFNHSTIEPFNHSTIVMIQCVGSRDEKHKYCSRICCSAAVKNALKILKINPGANVFILYKDMRTYGFKEDLYRKARELGVLFIRYDDNNKPFVQTDDGKIAVRIFEPVIKEDIEIKPDLLVLSSGIEPNETNGELAKMLKVPLNSDNFFLEAHVKLRPVDFATEGIFVCGMAHSPKLLDEAITQAEAAAARATTVLANKKYYAEATVSYVNEELCAGCGMCSALCPYEAIEIITKDGKKISRVNEVLCKGCGTCAAGCPSGAMNQYGFTKQQIMEMVEAL